MDSHSSYPTMIKENIALLKMLKALDNYIRHVIVEHMLNSPPVSYTYIHKLVEGTRGETGKGVLSYHLDILMAGGVIEKKQVDKYTLYHITPETMKTLEHHELIQSSHPIVNKEEI